MYSRKFNGIGILPPDYSGVALRRDSQDSPQSAIDHPRKDPGHDPVPCHPRRPVFEHDSFEAPPASEEPSACPHNDAPFRKPDEKKTKYPHEDHRPPKDEEPSYKRSFSLEDIMLAGLLLLLMNDENTDNSLLIIVGLLLLVGM